MCLGVPAQVVDIHDTARATVSISGVSRMISTDLMMGEELAVGDWVLIHVGFALGKIDEAEATETLKQINSAVAHSKTNWNPSPPHRLSDLNYEIR